MKRIICITVTTSLFVLTGGVAQDALSGKADQLGFGNSSSKRPEGSKTEITAQEEATFNEKENKAVFLGDVRVKDHAFLLAADRLTIHMASNRSGIDRAIAEGHVVIVQQTEDSSEEKAIGRSDRAEYVPATGRVTLSGSAEIQQGINRHIATSPSTRMILNRDGSATTEGPSRTVITDRQETSILP